MILDHRKENDILFVKLMVDELDARIAPSFRQAMTARWSLPPGRMDTTSVAESTVTLEIAGYRSRWIATVRLTTPTTSG